MGSAYEMEPEDHVWASVVTGVVIGFAVGGALALLFAPKPGAQLRADLGDAVDDLKDKAEQIIDDLQGSTSQIVARSKAVLEQTRENIVRSVEAGKEAYSQKKEEMTAQLES
jgi:gas vesicle protein